MNTCTNLTERIDNTVELSSVCRGEWCRSLESDIDSLSSEMYECTRSGEMEDRARTDEFSRKIQEGYRNLSPDIRVLQ